MNFAAPAQLITLVQTQHQKENKFVNVKFENYSFR
jgi:hypothetical protein